MYEEAYFQNKHFISPKISKTFKREAFLGVEDIVHKKESLEKLPLDVRICISQVPFVALQQFLRSRVELKYDFDFSFHSRWWNCCLKDLKNNSTFLHDFAEIVCGECTFKEKPDTFFSETFTWADFYKTVELLFLTLKTYKPYRLDPYRHPSHEKEIELIN